MTTSRGIIPNDATFKFISRIVEPLLAVLSLVANSVIIIAFARCRKLRSNATGGGYNLLLVFLAIADLLFVLVTVPFGGLIHYGYPHNYYGCLILTSSTSLPILLTVSTLLVIAVDRFVSIRWPFNHEQYCSKPRIIKSVMLLWVVDAIFCFLLLAGFNSKYKQWVIDGKCSYHMMLDQRFHLYSVFYPLTLTPLVIMSVIYGYIFYVIIKLSKTVGPAQDAAESRRTAFLAAKKCGVIVLVFVVFILPIELLNLVEVYVGFRCTACMRMCSWGLLFHGFLCPIIYLYQNKFFLHLLPLFFFSSSPLPFIRILLILSSS